MVRWDLPVSTVQVDDVEIGYMELGEGHPLVLIMGLRGTMDLWDPRFVKALTRRHRVIMFDNRGMGFTSAGEKEFTHETFADDTAGFVTALGLEKPDVLGWSMGASIALLLALKRPDLVDRLILLAGGCGGAEAEPPTWEIRELMARDDLTIQEIVASLIPTQWIEAHPDIWEDYPAIRKMSDEECSERQLAAFETWPGCFAGLKNIVSPTLIIGGESDQVCPVDNAIMLNLGIPRSRMVLFSGAGHGLMYQVPEELAETVDDFLGGRKLTRKA